MKPIYAVLLVCLSSSFACADILGITDGQSVASGGNGGAGGSAGGDAGGGGAAACAELPSATPMPFVSGSASYLVAMDEAFFVGDHPASQVRLVPRAGCESNVTAFSLPAYQTDAVARMGDRLFWTTRADPTGNVPPKIMGCDISNCQESMTTVVSQDTSDPAFNSMVVRSGELLANRSDGRVFVVDPIANTVELFAEDPNAERGAATLGLTLIGDRIYWHRRHYLAGEYQCPGGPGSSSSAGAGGAGGSANGGGAGGASSDLEDCTGGVESVEFGGTNLVTEVGGLRKPQHIAIADDWVYHRPFEEGPLLKRTSRSGTSTEALAPKVSPAMVSYGGSGPPVYAFGGWIYFWARTPLSAPLDAGKAMLLRIPETSFTAGAIEVVLESAVVGLAINEFDPGVLHIESSPGSHHLYWSAGGSMHSVTFPSAPLP